MGTTEERRTELVRKLKTAFEEAKKRDRSFERALHFRATILTLEEELFEVLTIANPEEEKYSLFSYKPPCTFED